MAEKARIEALVQQVGEITRPSNVFSFYSDSTYFKVGGQQLTAKCIFCKMLFTGAGATRFVDHTSRCALAPPTVANSCNKLIASRGSKRKAKEQATALVQQEAELQAEDHRQFQKTLKQQGIRAGLKCAQAHAADHAIANFFYANGLSFASATTGQGSLYHQMVAAIQQAPSSYMPPTRKKLAGPLLDESYNLMWANQRTREKDGYLAMKFGATYVSDGWESCDHLPLINSAFITAANGGMYWRSVDTSGKTKDSKYCAALMISDIYSFGCTDVVLVITDTCSTMRRCWEIVQNVFCFSHPWLK
ncbi:hypothetical protein AB1Y20_012974 [Prymnesium parvum]|uniref:DUF659 domain-containing protein n=1 Tax=Prymnesium parvum TaxID=97485 RepID=A0AB34IMV4_PRYPA